MEWEKQVVFLPSRNLPEPQDTCPEGVPLSRLGCCHCLGEGAGKSGLETGSDVFKEAQLGRAGAANRILFL